MYTYYMYELYGLEATLHQQSHNEHIKRHSPIKHGVFYFYGFHDVLCIPGEYISPKKIHQEEPCPFPTKVVIISKLVPFLNHPQSISLIIIYQVFVFDSYKNHYTRYTIQ